MLSRCVLDRLTQGLQLDVHGKHAADTDDVFFSLATVCLFAASYASSPLHQAADGDSTSAHVHHPFSLLLMLGSAAAGVAGAAVIHALVGFMKSPSKFYSRWMKWFRQGITSQETNPAMLHPGKRGV